MHYVYILFCNQKIYYIGSTDNLERRIEQHRRGESTYTQKFSDIKLVYSEPCPTRLEAERRELQIKGWRIAKKKALIAGDTLLLKQLSRS